MKEKEVKEYEQEQKEKKKRFDELYFKVLDSLYAGGW